jgi:glycosyltransferase involved in cell wall biosynthesis
MAAKISVVIPCYNSTAFLAEAVESAARQSRRDFELVLVDDGSTDDTRALIAELAAQHGQISTVLQSNRGVAGARNAGIAVARGHYILPLDADDLIAPTMLEACARILDGDPQTALVFTDREDFGLLAGIVSSGVFELARLKYFNQIPYGSMFRRRVWEAIGGYRTNVSGFDDWDFWLAAAARGFRGHHIAQPLLHHRRHQGSQLGQIVGDYERLYATIILNNREVYSAEEIAAAHDYLAAGKVSSLLRSSRLIFEHKYLRLVNHGKGQRVQSG